jgi:hypothetical protein
MRRDSTRLELAYPMQPIAPNASWQRRSIEGDAVEFLEWIENSDVMTWVRESTSLLGYTLYLSAHTIGLVFLLGPVVAMSLRVYGVLPRLPMAPFRSYFRLMMFGFVVNLLSGTVLFSTAPVGFVKNLVFLFKLVTVILGAITLRRFLRYVYGDPAASPEILVESPRARWLLGVSLAFWAVGITAGRLTAYSAYVIKQTVPAVVVVFVIIVAAAGVLRALRARREHGTLVTRAAAVRGE